MCCSCVQLLLPYPFSMMYKTILIAAGLRVSFVTQGLNARGSASHTGDRCCPLSYLS